ncbi:MAG: phosphodiester glycosidase family protein [Candidatus Marinimicrobia bacterium]|nr:phosphodiester glycosidase family protein [Candidatus Neomarinimicrobiota bacterium]
MLRSGDRLLLYNHFYGDSTGTSSEGTEVRIRPLGEWFVNDTVYAVMEEKSNAGNMSINRETAILSAEGTAAAFLEKNYRKGDTVKILLELRPFEDLSASGVSYNYLPVVHRIKYLMGGYPTLVRKGENAALEAYAHQGGTGSFATDLHPRTAVGFDRDTSTMYLVVVDGRQSHSAGIDLPDLADIMIELGAWSAMNFDGGRSSVMIVGDEIQNSPSDGHERAVRNCCAVYSTAPEGDLQPADRT